MKKVNVCIAGGGSTWTPGILVGMIKKKLSFPLNKLVLFDNNPERLKKMGEYAKIVLRDYLPDVECYYTCDEKEAFEDPFAHGTHNPICICVSVCETERERERFYYGVIFLPSSQLPSLFFPLE